LAGSRPALLFVSFVLFPIRFRQLRGTITLANFILDVSQPALEFGHTLAKRTGHARQPTAEQQDGQPADYQQFHRTKSKHQKLLKRRLCYISSRCFKPLSGGYTRCYLIVMRPGFVVAVIVDFLDALLEFHHTPAKRPHQAWQSAAEQEQHNHPNDQ
jgi:hypothetical protein